MIYDLKYYLGFLIVSKRYGTNKGPTWDFIWVLYGHPIWDWDGICNTVSYGAHMGKPIWVTNGNHMGPSLDLAQVSHVQPTFVE